MMIETPIALDLKAAEIIEKEKDTFFQVREKLKHYFNEIMINSI